MLHDFLTFRDPTESTARITAKTIGPDPPASFEVGNTLSNDLEDRAPYDEAKAREQVAADQMRILKAKQRGRILSAFKEPTKSEETDTVRAVAPSKTETDPSVSSSMAVPLVVVKNPQL